MRVMMWNLSMGRFVGLIVLRGRLDSATAAARRGRDCDRRRGAGAGWLLAVAVSAGWAACAPHRPPSTPVAAVMPAVGLEFLAHVIIPTDARFPALGDRPDAFGSLSGLARDEASGQYLAVNDDRIGARVVWLDLRYTGGSLTVTPTRLAPLSVGPGVDERRVTAADLEAIAALPDGTFVAAEEGHVVGEGRLPFAGVWPPALLTLDRDARVTSLIEFPAIFAVAPPPAPGSRPSASLGAAPGAGSQPTGGVLSERSESKGIRDNQGFESVTRTPDGRLVAGLEQPRYEDGEPPRFDRGARSRLVEFVPEGGGWQARRQWMYELSPTPRTPGFDRVCNDGENGLSDLLALDATRLLSIERSCLLSGASVARNAIRIYQVDVTGADDVSGIASLAGSTARPVRKTLVLDLDRIVPRLSRQLAGLENFEALAFGPPLPGGRRTLLVVSDNNFRETQKTAFLLFALR